ncbi:hypothetical protein C8J56DRAFT_90902 [Mycena floridula]|nr:hypothetical protein C8J56DRAFT_90902 [Mycena floridula]
MRFSMLSTMILLGNVAFIAALPYGQRTEFKLRSLDQANLEARKALPGQQAVTPKPPPPTQKTSTSLSRDSPEWQAKVKMAQCLNTCQKTHPIVKDDITAYKKCSDGCGP